jgi:hypothetical protein
MNEAFAILLIGIGIAAQTDRQTEARRIDQERVRFIGSPTLRPAAPVSIIPLLKKMENK